MTVYLIYESAQRPLVEVVAEKLGRGKSIIDRRNFPDGRDLADTIRTLLSRATFAVFFASKDALVKEWPLLELSICEQQVKSGAMEPPLVVLIDVTVMDLPIWLRSSIAHESPTSDTVVRAILDRMNAKRSNLFVGRENDITHIRGELSRNDAVKILLLAGLEGIGRRTLARHLLNTTLNTRLGQTYMIGENDDLSNLYLRAKENVERFKTQADLVVAATEFRRLLSENPAKAVQELAQALSSTTSPKEALVLIDSGDACFQETGEFTPQVLALLAEMQKKPDLFVVLITRRLPRLSSRRPSMHYLVSHRVPHLSLDATVELLSLQLKISKMTTSKAEVVEIANYLDGYPVAIEWAAETARRYGLATLRNDKTSLIELKTHQFQPFIEKVVDSKVLRKQILRYLASTNLATLELLEIVTGTSGEALLHEIKILIDLSLVETQNDAYKIAAPVRDAVTRLYQHLTSHDHDQIVERIKGKYDFTGTAPLPSFDIIEQLILSSDMGSRQAPQFVDLQRALPATVARAAQESYDTRDWRRAVNLARSVLEMDGPTRRDKPSYGRQLRMRRIVVKGLVRSKAWTEAEHELKILEDSGDPKRDYIRGFFEAKRGNTQQAENSFARAMKAGDHSLSVIRDRAACLLHLGKAMEARRLLDTLPGRGSSNKYILDLLAKINISTGAYAEALAVADQLEALGEADDAAHRRASVFAEQGQAEAALAELKRASHLREEGQSLKASMLIDVKRYSEAEEVIDSLESGSAPQEDVKNGLYCKLWLRQRNWRKAESYFRAIKNKNTPIHKALRKELDRQKEGALTPDPRLPGTFWEFDISDPDNKR
jgi:tetratricopeptide (TPR) repeat protein